MSTLRDELAAVIYGGKVINPYEGFPADDYPLEDNGGGATPIFGYVFDLVKPRFVIEVGSWKGMSALWMGNWLREHIVPAQSVPGGHDFAGSPAGSHEPALENHPLILCIDTWLGCPEIYQAETSGVWGINGKRKFGRPQIYEQFLANVIRTELTEYILPFSTTSASAAQWLRMRMPALQADVIYIDASHDEPDVLRDCIDYWGLLKVGGVMFGDDYDRAFSGVIKAVTRFAEMKKVSLEIVAQERKWVLWKK